MQVRPYILDNNLGAGYLVFLATSMLLAGISTCMVNFGETVSAGSGIPEVKSYLNGVNYMRFLKAKTGAIKVREHKQCVWRCVRLWVG